MKSLVSSESLLGVRSWCYAPTSVGSTAKENHLTLYTFFLYQLIIDNKYITINNQSLIFFNRIAHLNDI